MYQNVWDLVEAQTAWQLGFNLLIVPHRMSDSLKSYEWEEEWFESFNYES